MSRKPRTPKPAEWISTSDIADKYSLSSEFFTDRIGKDFKRGEHVINCTPQAWRPTYRWSIEAVHTWFTSNEVVADLLKGKDNSAA
ncbi:hypothetical protein U2F10_25840 [Leptothoe sp. EHU-05/26/07-4]